MNSETFRPDDGRYAPLDRALYREHNRVERLINRLEHRRGAPGL